MNNSSKLRIAGAIAGGVLLFSGITWTGKANIDNTKAVIIEMKDMINSLRADLNNTDSELKLKTQQLADLQKQSETNNNNYTSQIEELQNQITTLTNEKEQLEEQIEELESNLNKKSEENKTLLDEIKRLERELTTANNDAEELEEYSKSILNEIKQSQTDKEEEKNGTYRLQQEYSTKTYTYDLDDKEALNQLVQLSPDNTGVNKYFISYPFTVNQNVGSTTKAYYNRQEAINEFIKVIKENGQRIDK